MSPSVLGARAPAKSWWIRWSAVLGTGLAGASLAGASLAGCGGCLGAPEGAGAAPPATTQSVLFPQGTVRGAECDVYALQDVGATWVYPGVTCPFGPDQVAIDACVTGGWAALIGAQGYPTLAEAVAAARPADTVHICPGVHPDLFTARDITLLAADPTPDATVLDGGAGYVVTLGNAALKGVSLGPNRVVQVENGTSADFECISVHDHTYQSKSVISGGGSGGTLTVRHSSFARSATKVISAGALLVVEDSAFLENTPNAQTGEVVVSAGGITLRRTAFLDNSQFGYGPTCLNINPGLSPYTSLIEDCWFEGNLSVGVGGEIITVAEELTVRGTTFRENRSTRGACCLGHTGRGTFLTVTDSTFQGNISAAEDTFGEGGGVLYGRDQVTLERTRFEDNVSGSAVRASTFYVGHEQWSGTDLVVRRNTGGEAALWVAYSDHATCECCDFGAFGDDNSPADGYEDIPGQLWDQLPLDFAL